jgi:hypothetical protein
MSMTSDIAWAVKGGSGFLSGSHPCKDPGHSVLSTSVVCRIGLVCRKVCQGDQIGMGIGNENDQALKGHSVDALACTGDEGRDTLR